MDKISESKEQLQQQIQILQEREAQAMRLSQAFFFRYRLSPTPGFEYISASVTSITGYTPEAYYADPHLPVKRIHLDNYNVFQQLMTAPETLNFPVVFRSRHKDGTDLWLEMTGSLPTYDETGQLIRIEGVVHNITRRMQMARELEQRVAQLTIINEISSQIATLMNLNSVLDRTAHLVQETFGYDHVALFLLDGEVIRLKAVAGLYEHIFPQDYNHPLSQGIIGWVGSHGEKVIANDVNAEPRYVPLIPGHTETQAKLCLPIKLGGETVGVLDIQSPQINAFGTNDVIAMETLCAQIAVGIENARLYETIQQELAEHRQTAESLRQSEQVLGQVISSISDHIYVTDISETNLPLNLYLSPHIEPFTGYPLEKFMNDWHFWTSVVVHPEDEERVKAQASRLLAGHNSETEYRLIRANGEVIWVRDSGRVEKDLINQRTIVYGVVSDISGRKVMETQLVQSQKLEAIGQLAAGIAHEINTPTQYIGDNISFLQQSFNKIGSILEKYHYLLQTAKTRVNLAEIIAEVDQTLEKAQLDYLLQEIPLAIEESLDGIQRVTHIVQAMKEFSHPGVQNKTALNLNHAIESTITVARNEWKYVADVETYFDADLPPVLCMASEFNQIILNILVNAAHAINDAFMDKPGGKGKITIITRYDGEWAEIRISDSGTGIPEAIRAKVFEPFFTTKEVGKGTGQGLAIAHALIVKQLGGTISFETEIGRGTTFIIRLPIEADGQVETNNVS